MNKLLVLNVISAMFLFTVSQIEISNGQQLENQTNIPTNLTKLFQEKYSRNVLGAQINEQLQRDTDAYNKQLQVVVEYESPTTVLISGELITESDLIFNSFLWQAMDVLQNEHGFKLQQVFTSGQGSKGNPTNVFILMTK